MKIILKSDPKKQEFVFIRRLNRISTGPVSQFSPSRVCRVEDFKGTVWEFRMDDIKFKNPLEFILSYFKN